MGPLVGLAAILPAILTTAASVPQMIGGIMAGKDKPQEKPNYAPLLSDNPATTLANHFGKEQPYVFGSGTHLTVNPTLGNFGGFGSGSIQDRSSLVQNPNSASQLTNYFKSLAG